MQSAAPTAEIVNKGTTLNETERGKERKNFHPALIRCQVELSFAWANSNNLSKSYSGSINLMLLVALLFSLLRVPAEQKRPE